ncbi:MAG: tetratricopeptide repeat protein [Acidobacteriota bacterium]
MLAAWKFGKLAWLAAFAVLLTPVFYFKGISLALVSERYLYLPSVIPAILLSRMITPRSTWWVAAVVAVFGGLTMARNLDWQDSERLYAETLAHDPENAYLHLNLAEIILKRGNDAEARQHLTAAAQTLATDKYTFQPYETYRAYVGLGAIAARAQNYAEARADLERARQAHPNGEWPYLYLGGIAMEADNNIPQAIEYLNTAIRLGPINEVARDYMESRCSTRGAIRKRSHSFRKRYASIRRIDRRRSIYNSRANRPSPSRSRAEATSGS